MKEQLVQGAAQTVGGTNTCKSITIHETSNTAKGADAQAHANLQSAGNSREASWHITVDDTETIRSYPDTAQCWHAGTREGNESSIAVEICVNSDGDYDKAFARAGKVVADLRTKHGLGRKDVVQHNHWTGKECPALMRAAGRWQEFLDLTDPKETTMSQMFSPFEGRLTANHRTSGGYTGHRGMDIAPPLPGQTGRPVYAAFAGTVKKICRGVKHGNLASTWAPMRTGNGVLIANPDGEGNGYNHVTPLASLQLGDWVEAGDLIGHNDTSGNQSGPHLHFEMWKDWKNPASDYDPRDAFDAHKVKPGSKPALDLKPVGTIKPRPTAKPVTKPAGTVKPKPEGYDPNVKAYQDRQLYYPNMKRDGIDGPMNKAHKKWVIELQTALNEWASDLPKLVPDGDYAGRTGKRVEELERRNLKGAYRAAGGRAVDQIAGPVVAKMLGIRKHPSA